jgi:hypothetical protein
MEAFFSCQPPLGRSTLGMAALSLSHQTVNWTAPYFDAYMSGERGRNALELDKIKQKNFHRRNAYVAIVSLRKPRGMRKALNSHCTIAVADRSAPLLPHLLLFTAPTIMTRGRDLMKIAR